MLSKRFQLGFALAVTGLLSLPVGSWAQEPKVLEQSTELVPRQPRLGLEDLPSGQAVVTYQNGKLTIRALNAPLIEVLRAVCNQIGAVLDLSSVANESIVAIIGPGPAREVLASLLDNSQSNYAVLRSASDPTGVARVIVFPKTKDSEPIGLVAQARTIQAPVSPTDSGNTPVAEKSVLNQVKDLIATAKVEVSNSGESGIYTKDGQETVDATAFLQQIESQLNSVANVAVNANGSSDNPLQTGQQDAAAASQSPLSIPRRHRR